jgi:hypothetical protein
LNQQSIFSQANLDLNTQPITSANNQSEKLNSAFKEKLKSTSNNKLLDVDEIDAEMAGSSNLNTMMNMNGNLAKLNRFKTQSSFKNETSVSPNRHQNSSSTSKYQQPSQQQQNKNTTDINLLSNLRKQVKPNSENMSRSFSLNDLISAANELVVFNTDELSKGKNLRDKPIKNENIHSKYSISSYNLAETSNNYNS